MANSDNSSMHEGTHRTRRSVGRVGAVAIALVLGGAASFVTAFAHHIVSTTPTPTVGVVGTTPLADTALVYADNTRTVVFFLWAPGTCGSPNGTPVFTDSEPVTTSTLINSTVTSATYVPKVVGTYQWTAEITVNADGSIENGPTACGDEPVTVNQHGSSISTTPSNGNGASIGTDITDSAHVTGDNPTGTVTFWLYGPNDPNCAVSQVAAAGSLQSWTETLDSSGNASVPAPGYTTNADGTYNWVATYSGDSNNVGATSSCGAESVVISKNNSSITTDQSNQGGAIVGTTIKDTAKVTGNNPSGSVTFFLYGPNDTNCVNNADSGLKWLQSWTVTLDADGKASVPDPGYTTTQTGRFQWVAHYSGDANNTDAWSTCGNEPVKIDQASPTIVTVASSGGPVGTQIHDTAQVSGGDNPTGTVTFNLYSPSNPTCSANENGNGAVQSVTVTLGSDGSASSAISPYTTSAVGTYNWIAVYSGDANNNGASTSCKDESVNSGVDPSAITTTASAGGNTGTVIHDTATVTGSSSLTGTVTFSLFAPSDATCTGTALFTSTVPLGAGGVATSANFSATTIAGTYNWMASYSGDSTVSGATSKCGSEPVSIIARGVQGITTSVPGTGAAGGIGEAGIGLELLLGGLALGLTSELVRERRRA
ncbi:MAG: hypothetical protein ABSC35_12720 [Candidatus Dormibacteria bacterium]